MAAPQQQQQHQQQQQQQQQQQPLTGFNFGNTTTPTATVQPQQQSSGLPFGATQQPGFGLATQTGQSSFGQSTVPVNTVQPLSFSTPTSQASTGMSFGQPSSQPSTGLSFGQPATTASTGLSFGQPTAPTGLSFGQPTATTAPPTLGVAPLSFSMPSSVPQPQTQTGFSFGQPTQTTASTAAPSLGFSLPSSIPSAAPALSLNPLTTTTPSTGLSFGQPTSQVAPLFGATQPQHQQLQQQQQPSLLGSLTSQPLAPLAASTTGLQQAAPQSFGLGGIDMNATQPKVAEGKHESTKVKETQMPNEIVQTVDEFKAYIKQQKTLSSDIVRTTDRKLKSVTEDTKKLNCTVQAIANDVDNNKLAIKLLRSDTSKIIQHADMAQRTHETPSGLQFENVMPQIYFNELIHKYENDLMTLKHQVELTEKHLQSLANPQNFSAQDLKRGLHQIHESFIALAGRLQETHTKVETQKEQYLTMRKFMLRDSTNVFEVEQDGKAASTSTKVQFGPNPFTNSMLGSLNMSNSLRQQQWSAAPQHQQQQQHQPPPTNNSFFGTNTSFGFKKM